MPDDPNKNMDELLKAYARDRRKAPELNLHPATRKMLQGEVSRVLGSANPPRSWFHRFRSFWPQIAFGTSLCLILGIAVFSLRQPPPTSEKQETLGEKTLEEKNVKAAEDAFLAPALEAPRPEQDSSVLLKKKDGVERLEAEELKQVELQLLKREQPQPVAPALEPAKERFVLQEAQVQKPAPTTLQRDTAPGGGVGGDARSKPLPAQAQSLRVESLQDQPDAKPATATDLYSVDKAAAAASPSSPVDSEARSRAARAFAQSGATAPPSVSGASANGVAGLPPVSVANRGLQISPAEKLARVNEMTNLGAARRLQFVQMTSAPAPTTVSAVTPVTAPAALFTSFQMEQLGRDIRFLENDGSVYFGSIDQPTNLPGQVVAGATVAERRLDGRLYEQSGSAAAPTNTLAFSFTAQGTNVTLGKNIVLTGQYFERTNTGPSALDSLSVYQKTPAAGRAMQRQESQHTIIGTAVIGATNQIPLRAVSRE